MNIIESFQCNVNSDKQQALQDLVKLKHEEIEWHWAHNFITKGEKEEMEKILAEIVKL